MYSYYLKEPKKQPAEGQQLSVPKPKPEKQKLPVKTSLSDLSVGEWMADIGITNETFKLPSSV